ncbi:MAG: acyl-CoA synthetase [Alphaproteobacteria bacterium]|nr:MAG: acyl-CoA synthetase [Alphaproteobacteria bacterium]
MGADAAKLPPFRKLPFKLPDIEVRRGEGGVVYLSSRTPLGPVPRSMPHVLDERAAEHPDRPWLKQREPNHGPWRSVSYGDGAKITRSLAQALLDRGLGPDAPLLILSGNSIEHALIQMAAMRIGAPATPISMAYSVMSTDFAKLKHCFNAVQPKAIFVQTMDPFRKALATLPLEGVAIISADGSEGSEAFAKLAETSVTSVVDTAMDWLGPDSIGKYLFTSGSTGMPKPAPQTQGQMTAQIAARNALDQPLPDHDPNEVLQNLDWMPWSHISGGNVNYNGCLALGGTFHIDEGRPMPGLFATTMKNAAEVRPQYFGSAPIAYAMLAEAMEQDPEFRDAFFSRMKYMVYGGATLSDDLYDRIQALAIASTGERIPLITMYGATETQGITMVHWELERVGMVGLPLPGQTLKLVPSGNKMEVRVKGPMVMAGYLNLPEKNKDVFDEEGFYCLGDATRFSDPEHPEKGLVFDGRVTEDFKLNSGTWVSVGTLRPDIVAACAPLVADAIVCGQDKPYVGALLWPSPAAMKAAMEAAGGDGAKAIGELTAQVAQKLAAFNATQPGSSRRVGKFKILTTPPSLDAGEITDKGYVNQRVAQDHRVTDVASLFSAKPEPGVVALS